MARVDEIFRQLKAASDTDVNAPTGGAPKGKRTLEDYETPDYNSFDALKTFLGNTEATVNKMTNSLTFGAVRGADRTLDKLGRSMGLIEAPEGVDYDQIMEEGGRKALHTQQKKDAEAATAARWAARDERLGWAGVAAEMAPAVMPMGAGSAALSAGTRTAREALSLTPGALVNRLVADDVAKGSSKVGGAIKRSAVEGLSGAAQAGLMETIQKDPETAKMYTALAQGAAGGVVGQAILGEAMPLIAVHATRKAAKRRVISDLTDKGDQNSPFYYDKIQATASKLKPDQTLAELSDASGQTHLADRFLDMLAATDMQEYGPGAVGAGRATRDRYDSTMLALGNSAEAANSRIKDDIINITGSPGSETDRFAARNADLEWARGVYERLNDTSVPGKAGGIELNGDKVMKRYDNFLKDTYKKGETTDIRGPAKEMREVVRANLMPQEVTGGAKQLRRVPREGHDVRPIGTVKLADLLEARKAVAKYRKDGLVMINGNTLDKSTAKAAGETLKFLDDAIARRMGTADKARAEFAATMGASEMHDLGHLAYNTNDWSNPETNKTFLEQFRGMTQRERDNFSNGYRKAMYENLITGDAPMNELRRVFGTAEAARSGNLMQTPQRHMAIMDEIIGADDLNSLKQIYVSDAYKIEALTAFKNHLGNDKRFSPSAQEQIIREADGVIASSMLTPGGVSAMSTSGLGTIKRWYESRGPAYSAAMLDLAKAQGQGRDEMLQDYINAYEMGAPRNVGGALGGGIGSSEGGEGPIDQIQEEQWPLMTQ